MKQIDDLLRERPAFHRSETEISRYFDPSESLLPREEAKQVSLQASACYGISPDVAYFLRDSVGSSCRSLETGAGISTLIFALRGATHTAVTPNRAEVEEIQKYAAENQIDLARVEFVVEASEQYLPRCTVEGLDLVLIDGKHAFPWPALDWFFTADRLRQGGLLLLDDANIKSIGILVAFLMKDLRWSLVTSFGNKIFAFRKERELVHDVAWHMQPYNFGDGLDEVKRVSFLRRLLPSRSRR